jgi:protein-tyrosine kinase
MEKLQKALERARLQRQATAAEQVAAEVAQGGNRPGDVKTITYRETRVVQTQEHSLSEQRVVSGTFQEELSDTFRILRTQVLARLTAETHTTLAITSSGRGEGKTLTAVNLATSVALDPKHTVLLVDADLRRPSLHRYFGIDASHGLADYLVDDKPISACLVNPGVPRLVLLPAGRALRESSEVLSSPKMARLAQELKARYPDRIVIYDLAPLLSSSDALTFLPYVEAILLVTQEGATRKADVVRALELLQGFNVIGTVLNRSSEKIKSYT